ncbi:aldose epimerase family protein [Salinisphaera sp.]|uniref:aldose epimerase family protein n=1 Tax=Salinisphaera sp. TaxID=1914330 RepID=UPI002D7809B6|nr:aldose epimerase family protein [Salinisphaera sp.]HET7313540.1 aldose epimerase family protein [Salinisphaera sp.]
MNRKIKPAWGLRLGANNLVLTALVLAALLIAGPALAASDNSASGDDAGGTHLAVTVSSFGNTPQGQPVDRYHLSNRNGMSVDIITFGARVQAIRVPGKNGQVVDVALGYDNVKAYTESGRSYMGATIGRYANRIAGGKFTLNGKTYHLAQNNGPNNLHGGPIGFDQHVWQARPIHPTDAVGVEMSYLSPDGQMGFPGDLVTTVRYTLNNDNELRIHYSAVSDKDTVINLTNHTYFNMAGAGNGTVLDQIVMINADRYSPIDKTEIPLGESRPVKGTPFDFTTPTPIGKHIGEKTKQELNAEPKQGGYDHNWILNTNGDLDKLAARVTDPQSGRTILVYTTEPGLQFYTSNFLHGQFKGIGGTYQHWGAFTLETQHFPDSPNHPSYPSTELKAGQKFTSTTIFKFLP